MSIFKLDPDSVSQRVTARGESPRIRSLWATVLQGALGFGLVGLLAFAVWAWGGRWLMSYVGKYGFYGEVAVAFIGLAGLALGRLVIGPGALARFYGLFTLGFVLYSIVWCAIYFTLPGLASGKTRRQIGGDLWIGSRPRCPLSPATRRVRRPAVFSSLLGRFLFTRDSGLLCGRTLPHLVSGRARNPGLGILLWRRIRCGSGVCPL